jgi:hypothetical protein
MKAESSKKDVVTSTITLTLVMTLEEATALRFVADRIGGSAKTTGRAMFDVLTEHLAASHVPSIQNKDLGWDSGNITMPEHQAMTRATRKKPEDQF